MQTTTCHWTSETGWVIPASAEASPQLVLYFGSAAQLQGPAQPIRALADRFPGAVLCGCSTAGEILGSRIADESVVAALVTFRTAQVRGAVEPISAAADSRATGARLAAQIHAPGLRHALVLSDGLDVNGTALLAGMRGALPDGVRITGGLAGDGTRFQRTLVGLGAEARRDQVAAVGFFGDALAVGCSSRGGWEGFGPRRRITRAEGNTLLELDGQPALGLYKRYLGELAAGLPATGLLFPLELTPDVSGGSGLVRTILAVDESRQSLTFAGDLPEGWYARLMKATVQQLVDGAAQAGHAAAPAQLPPGGLAILISCVGRRLVLGQRAEDELEAVLTALPEGTAAIGFYSYGEACTCGESGQGELHNQTMTLTVISEHD